MTDQLRLLLVEDSESDAELVAAELRRSGFGATLERVDSEAGLRAALARQAWDLVICDYSIPGFAMVEALALVQEAAPETPFVIFSGQIGEEAAVEALKAGARDCVLKSNMPRLLRVIERELREAESRRRGREAEEELRQSRELYRSLVENSIDMITLLDLAGVVLYASPAWRSVQGYDPAKVIGRSYPELVHPEDLPAAADLFADILAGHPVSYGIRVRHRDGRWIPVEGSGTPIPGADGSPAAVLAITRDVTTRIEAERERASLEDQLRQAQKLEAVGRLAGGIAHDFNNLLLVIQGYGELAARRVEGVDEAIGGYLAQIKSACDRAIALTRQLLAFSRRQVVQSEVLDVREVVANMESLLRPLIGEDVTVVSRLAPEPATALADRGQLEQVVTNLAVNARDAMPGGGRLTIAVENVELGGPQVLLSLADTGFGMDEETRERIFEPFFTTKEEGKGTGLGLATVFGIVKQAGGHIRVESEPDAGTTFHVYLPRAEAEPEAGERPVEPASGSETILLVEAEDEIRALVRSLLEDGGYTVLAASGPDEALEAVARHEGRLDLIVADLVGGRALLEPLREARPGLKALYLSSPGVGSSGTSVLAPEAGLLQRPFGSAEFMQSVRCLLDRE